MNEEIYTVIDDVIHRVKKIQGLLVKEKQVYINKLERRIASLSVICDDIYRVIDLIHKEENKCENSGE